MIKVNVKSLVACLVLAISVVSASGIEGYVGGKVNYGTFKPKGYSKLSPIGIGLGGGLKYNIIDELFVGGEAYLNYAVSKPKNKGNKLEYGLSGEVNVLAGVNFTKNFNIYALVGAVDSKPKFNDMKYKNNISSQYGIGIGYNTDDGVGIRLQYVLSNPKYKVANRNSIKTKNDTISLALNYNF